MIYAMGEASGFRDGISEETEDVRPEETVEDFLGEIRRIRKRKESEEGEEESADEAEREEEDIFKSIFGVGFDEWQKRGAKSSHGTTVYGKPVEKKKDKSYQTEFTQNIMNYSRSTDMRADKKEYQHGVSTTYKQVSAYCLKRGRTRGRAMRGVGRRK